MIEHKVVGGAGAPVVLESLAPEPVTVVSAPAPIAARIAEAPAAPEQAGQQQQTIVIHTAPAAAPAPATAAPPQPVLPTQPAAPTTVVPQALPSAVTAKIMEAARKQQAAVQHQQQQQQRQQTVTVSATPVVASRPQLPAAPAPATAAPQPQPQPPTTEAVPVKLSNITTPITTQER